ncbi:MAG: 16S rRNA (guanine(966)-N(2))-methyltransferase RsmD [bacterium]
MRVISGKAKGTKLKAPDSARPLTDRAKEALYNILRAKVVEASFLDLFAGSGAVGIEALSRGAKAATFVELDRKAIAIIKENLAAARLQEPVEIIPLDVIKALKILTKSGQKFDIIYLGAPYDSPALPEALNLIGSAQLLNTKGIVIAEHRRQHQVEDVYGNLKAIRQERYGETVFKFFTGD